MAKVNFFLDANKLVGLVEKKGLTIVNETSS